MQQHTNIKGIQEKLADISDQGPCAGGIIVTYSQWRVIFWLQAAMAGLGLALSLGFVPTINRRVDSDLGSASRGTTSSGTTSSETASSEGPQEKPATTQSPIGHSLSKFNPVRVFKQFLHPEILLAVSSMFLKEMSSVALISSLSGHHLWLPVSNPIHITHINPSHHQSPVPPDNAPGEWAILYLSWTRPGPW